MIQFRHSGLAIVSAVVIGLYALPMTLAKPQPTQPSPRPSEPRPADSTPRNTNPKAPGERTAPESREIPGTTLTDPNNPDPARRLITRNPRPFSLQNPTDEARFSEGSKRLVRLEEKMAKTNLDLLKRLSDVRQLSPDKQSAATMDLLQKILKSQTETQRYLVYSRSMWTGDVQGGQPQDGNGGMNGLPSDGQNNPANPAENTDPTNPSNPINPGQAQPQNPPTNPQQPGRVSPR